MISTLLALAFAQGAPAPVQTKLPDAAEIATVVRLIRTNYAGYAATKALYEETFWNRLEKAAEKGGTLESLHAYIRAFEDPDLRYSVPSPSQPGRRLRVYGGPELFQTEEGAGSELVAFRVVPQDDLVDVPKSRVPRLVPGNIPELARLAGSPAGRAVILDFRESAPGSPLLDLALGYLVDRSALSEPGMSILVTPDNLRAWKDDPRALPGQAATLARMKRARPGTLLPLTSDRTVRVIPRPGFERVAILVGHETSSDLARFVQLARQSPRVRVFGTSSPPIGERGTRAFTSGEGHTITIPTIISRGEWRVEPDEDVRSLPSVLVGRHGDFAHFRADQWCRLGE